MQPTNEATIEPAGELFPAAFPSYAITTTVRHISSGHVFTLTFIDTPLDKVLRVLEGRGCAPLEAPGHPRQGGSERTPVCRNPHCSNVGKPLQPGKQGGLFCSGRDEVSGNSKGYCKSRA